MEKLNDNKLMKLIEQKNSAAFKELYSRYGKKIFNFINRYTKKQELAQELLQETFTRVWFAAEKFDQKKGQLRSWIYTVALNTARNEMIKKEYSHTFVGEQEFLFDSNQSESNHSEEAYEELEKIETQKMVNKAIEELPPLMREIVVLKLFEQLKFREIARITDTPEGTLKARFHRAVAVLKKDFKRIEV